MNTAHLCVAVAAVAVCFCLPQQSFAQKRSDFRVEIYRLENRQNSLVIYYGFKYLGNGVVPPIFRPTQRVKIALLSKEKAEGRTGFMDLDDDFMFGKSKTYLGVFELFDVKADVAGVDIVISGVQSGPVFFKER